MLKADFKSFLLNYVDSLHAIFDFYQNEYQFTYPQQPHYRFYTLQPEVAFLILQDFDALG